MNEKSPPASYYEPPAGAPDQPSDLPTRCPYCHAFLRAPHNWEYERIPSERVVVYSTKCNACKGTVSVER